MMSPSVAEPTVRRQAPRRIAVAISIALVVVVSGCIVSFVNPDFAAPAPPPAKLQPAWPGCGQLAFTDDVTASSNHLTPVADGGAIPEDFVPQLAVLCAVQDRTNEAGDVVGTVGMERGSTELSPLLTYLSLPSRRALRPDNVSCPAIAIAHPWLVLVDALGRWMAPKIPVDPCGFPLDVFADGGTAYDNLPYIDTVVATFE